MVEIEIDIAPETLDALEAYAHNNDTTVEEAASALIVEQLEHFDYLKI